MADLNLRGLSGDKVTNAINSLKESLRKSSATVPEALTRFQAGQPGTSVYWLLKDGYWATIDAQESGKYACTFGTIDTETQTKQGTVCTINVQRDNPWWVGGAFATDGKAIYYLQWGRDTGKNDFASRFSGQRAVARWDDHSAPYLVAARLGDRDVVAKLGSYVKSIANFKVGGTLEDSYKSDFEQGLDEAIHDLEARLGGADAAAAPQAGPPSGGLQRGGQSGGLNKEDVEFAKARLATLKDLQTKLRLDPYLLAAPVERISNSVRADRRRRLVISIGASFASIIGGWLLSSINPSSFIGAGHGLAGVLAHVLPWLAR